MIDQEQFDILKKEVDTLQIQLSREQQPWYRTTSNIVALGALLFSFGTTGMAYFISHKNDIRTNRRDARTMIQRITRLPIEHFELQHKYPDNAVGQDLFAGAIALENSVLATQVTELLNRYPNTFSSTEYSAVAVSLVGAEDDYRAAPLFETAVELARTAFDYTGATRALAALYFRQGDYSTGRDYYEKALAVWKRFPEQDVDLRNRTDIITLAYWSEAEVFAKNTSDDVEKMMKRARVILSDLPPGSSESLTRMLDFVEEKIKQARSLTQSELSP